MPNPQLVNAVGGGSLSQELDLKSLYEAIDGEEVRYEPEHWPGLYLRYTSNAPAIMVFRTGKYNIAGAGSIQELNEANDEFLHNLQQLEINDNEPGFEIRNLVFLDQYEKELNLDQIVIALGLENAEYEPEQFPGIMYRPSDVTGTFVVFRNGKMILTGAKSLDNAKDMFSNLFDLLDNVFN